MRIVVTGKKAARLNRIIDWLIYMLGYAIVLIIVSLIFKKTIQIDSSYYGVWGFLAAIIIYLLNKTIKPIIVWFTLPITGITMGLFYPFINVIILNITDLILGSHFDIKGILLSFVVALCISLMNILMERLVIEPIVKRG